MSGFDEIFKDFENDVRIASHIPAEHRGRAIDAAAGAAALRAGWHTISGVFFDDNSSTWRDGKGNIVPAPSERGDSNRVFSRGMMLETKASRPVYNSKSKRWLDQHPQRPLDSDDSATVEAHLQSVFESNKHPITAEDARAMREVYERRPGLPKLPHYGGREAAIASRALAKLREAPALAGDGKSSVEEQPSSSVLVNNKERDRPALDERPRRTEPYSGDAISAPLDDADDDASLHNRFNADAAEPSETRGVVTRRGGHWFIKYQDREFGIPDSDPQEYNRHWQGLLAGLTGDDLAFGSALLRGQSQLHYMYGDEFVRDLARQHNHSEYDMGEARERAALLFGKSRDVEEAERRARFSGEPAAHRPLVPKRHVSEIIDSLWAKRPPKVPRHVGPAADEKAAPAPPRPAPVAPVAVGEDFSDGVPHHFEIEVNDAAGAPYQGPAYFDSHPVNSRLEALGGETASAAPVLLHEDQIELNRKRRWLSRVLVTADVTISYFSHSYLWFDYSTNPPFRAEQSFLARFGDAMDADLSVMSRARISAMWASSSTRALVPANGALEADGVRLVSRYAGEYSELAAIGAHLKAYAQNFLTYVPPGSGVSQRRGLRVSANYLQVRAVLSPAYLVPSAFRRSGTNDFVQPCFPYSSTSVKFSTATTYPSSTQALLTIHRVMFVLCTDPLLKFGDVVVDGNDIHSPVSLHTRGVLEVLKDVYVSSDKDEVHSVNLQLKGRAFDYTAATPVTDGGSPVNSDLVRGYHILALHTASVVAFPFDFYNAASSGGADYKSYLAHMSIPPTCALSTSFSFSDA